jgi:hypothetical protein
VNGHLALGPLDNAGDKKTHAATFLLPRLSCLGTVFIIEKYICSAPRPFG